MILSLVLLLAGGGLIASAALNGFEPVVAFGADWGRLVVAMLGAELVFLGGRAMVKVATGEHRRLLEMTLDQRVAEFKKREAGARRRSVFAGAAGIALAVLGIHDRISGGAIVLSGVGSVLFVVIGVTTGILALLPLIPVQPLLEQVQAGKERAAAAVAPKRRDPCSMCGSSNVCYGVSIRGGDGGVWAYHDGHKLEEMVGNICRDCGGVHFRVSTPDRNWRVASG